MFDPTRDPNLEELNSKAQWEKILRRLENAGDIEDMFDSGDALNYDPEEEDEGNEDEDEEEEEAYDEEDDEDEDEDNEEDEEEEEEDDNFDEQDIFERFVTAFHYFGDNWLPGDTTEDELEEDPEDYVERTGLAFVEDNEEGDDD